MPYSYPSVQIVFSLPVASVQRFYTKVQLEIWSFSLKQETLLLDLDRVYYAKH